MRKKVLIFLVCLFLLIINIIGCIEEDKTNKYPNLETRVLYVDDSGGKNFSRIQDAVNAANPGDTIFVFDGIYNETLLINTPINLIGSGSSNTKINSKVIDTFYRYSVFFTVDYCNISGFTITTDSNQSDIIGIRASSSNNIIENNIITNVTYGIYFLNDLKDYFISENRVLNNTISNCEYGIFVFSDFNNNIVSNNKIFNNREGIDLYQSTNNIISKNNISSNSIYGIFITYKSDSNNIYWNELTSNRYGIRFKGVTNNEIYANRIFDNEIGLYSCCEAENNILYYNSLIKNIQQASDSEVNYWNKGVIGNYWDDYLDKYPDANQLENFWDMPYNISGGNNKDNYPLIIPYI